MSTQPLNELGHFSNGLFSSFSMLCLMQPVFTAKTYVMEKKGFPPLNAWYKGFGANCAGVVPAQGIAFLTYGAVLKLLSKDKLPTNSDKLKASIVGGLASAPVAAAFERIMILQQLSDKKTGFFKTVAITVRESEKKGLLQSKKMINTYLQQMAPYTIFRQAIVREAVQKDLMLIKKISYMHLQETVPYKIFKQDGSRGFIKGLLPTVKRDVIFLAGLLSLYDFTEEQLAKIVRIKKISEIVAGFGVGAAVGFITAPADLVKTRMQADVNGSYSVVQTTKQIVRTTMAKEFIKSASVRSLLTGGAVVFIVQAKQFLPAYFPRWMQQK